MIQVAVVGIGHWGSNLVRNFLQHPNVEKVYCYDIDKQKIDLLRHMYPMVETVENYQVLLNKPLIKGVALATPISSHFDLSVQALKHDKHVLVEKPLATSTQQAKILSELAIAKGLKLMVDHIMLYHGAIRKIKQIIDAGDIGKILYFDTVRTSFGIFPNTVSVVWDLAIHDLALIEYLLSKQPKAISAMGINHFKKGTDVAYLTILFNDNCIGHIHVSWLSPVKIRKIEIGGTQKLIVFDDNEKVEKIRIYDQGFDSTDTEKKHIPLGREETKMYSIPFDTTEPLASVINEFICAIEQNYEPLTNGEMGRRIVAMLAAAEKSIAKKGTLVELS